MPELAPVTSATLSRRPRSIALGLPQVLVGAVQPVPPRRVEGVHIERVLQRLGRVRKASGDGQHLAGEHVDLLSSFGAEPEAEGYLENVGGRLVLVLMPG